VLCIICYISVLTQYFVGMIYTRVEENPRVSARGPEVSDLNIDAAYALDGGTPHGRYVKILIVFH
jgi:hypothetical protein